MSVARTARLERLLAASIARARPVQLQMDRRIDLTMPRARGVVVLRPVPSLLPVPPLPALPPKRPRPAP